MKKIMKLFVYVAAAATTLASCQKNEMDAPVKQELHFTIKAGIETKTVISDNGKGTYTPSWENGDEIGIFFTEPTESVEKVDATFSNTNPDGEEASFEGKATVEGEGTFFAFYPQSAFNQHYGDETIRLDLSAVQKPTSTSFDPECDILVAKPCDYLADGETVVIEDLYFARLMSVLKINLNGEFAQGEIVESLTFSVDGVDITGNAKVDYKNATITAWNNGNVDRNVVTASYAEDRYITIAEGNNAAYLVVAPVTVQSGTALTFTLKTTNYNISKTVNADKDVSFPVGNVGVINLTINEENCEAIVAETRIWVEGFDGETVNKTQTPPSKSEVAGTGVTENLTYSYSAKNCNIRINNNGQNATNPFLYIDAANSSFTASKIKIANEDKLALSAMVKGDGLKLTVEYKESASSTWSSAGTITGTSSYAQGRVIFAVPTTATSLDIRLTGNGVMYVDDIVLESTDEDVPVVTLESISISNQITEYTVGDAFVKPTVTATYSDETTQDVTGLATFSECDMTTVGDKTVTVTYEGKTAEYNFTVKEKGASSEIVEWVATSFADLKEGDQVVIVGTKSSATYAMSNHMGASKPPIPVEVTVSNDKLTAEPEENIIWSVGVNGSNRIFNASATTWLYCTSDNNGVRVGTNSNKDFTFENGYLKHVSTSRSLGIYLTQDWRCYTSHTSTNIANQTFKFFVKHGDSSEGGGETPEPEQKYLTVSQSVFNVTADQTSVTFDVNANVGWGLEESEGVETQIVGVSDDELVMTVEVTFPANETAEPKTHTVTFIPEELDENVTVTINQAAKVAVDDSFEPGQYWIMGTKNGATRTMTTTLNYGAYGYASSEVVQDNRSYPKNIFTFTAVAGGYTIQDVNGKYYYQNAGENYKTFNAGTDGSLAGCIWTISMNDDGTAKITNSASGRTIKFADGTYTSFGVYGTGEDNEQSPGVYPTLVKADNPLKVELSSISVSGHKTLFNEGDSFDFGGTVTATYNDGSTKNVTTSASVIPPSSMVDGAQVTVSYTEENVTKTFTYNIIVKATSQGGGDEPEQPATVTVSKTIADYAAANSWANATQYKTVNLDNVVTATVSGASNTGKYYTSGDDWRLYANENATLTISAANNNVIKSVKLTFTLKDYGALKYSTTTIESGITNDYDMSSITFNVASTSGNKGKVFITAIEVVYQAN